MIPGRTDFTKQEWQIVRRHRTPAQVQRFLKSIAYNHGARPTCLSFRGVIRERRAHCLEGAVSAATIMEQHGYDPILAIIESQDDLSHALFLFRESGRYGSVAMSREPGLMGRKPVFRTVRSLVMSYFDAYIDSTGRITGYALGDLRDLGGYDWRLSKNNVWKVERYLLGLSYRRIASSDARYQKWLRRFFEFRERHPGQVPEYFPKLEHLTL